MTNFRNLVIRHYESIVGRGKITQKTTILDLFEKMIEEDKEMIVEGEKCLKESNLTPEFVQETIDSIAVRINMLTHLNVDFIAEYEKNVIHQECRED